MLRSVLAVCLLSALMCVSASSLSSEFVEASFIEQVSESTSSSMAAGVGEGSPCAHNNKAGTCTSSLCSGTSVSGLCAGSAAIRCCIAPNAPFAPTLPVLGARCKAFGAAGTCADVSSCKGRSYYGFCAGSANVKCCVPAVTSAPYTSKVTPITASAAARLTESTHRAKWNRFKLKHNKRYSSQAVEDQRYAQFKRNRNFIVARNDALGRNEAIYKSDSPFADMDPAAFAHFYLGARPDATSSLVNTLIELNNQEAEAQAASAAERALFAQTGFETVMSESADEGSDFLEMESLVDGPATCTVGAAVGKCVVASTCSGTTYSGKCAGSAAIKCCIPKAGPVAPPTPSKPSNEPKWIIPRERKIGGTLTIDYRNILSPMKNQGTCGSCWAFASAETYETAGVRAGLWNNSVTFSPQQLVDCATSWAYGCGGAAPEAGLLYYKTKNSTYEKNYAYKGVAASCGTSLDTWKADGPQLTDYAAVRRLCVATPEKPCPNQENLKAALEKYGPMVIGVDANMMQFYQSGILPDNECAGKINHAVQLVGFGSEHNNKTGAEDQYWVIRNSWGQDWGEAGYIRVQAFSSDLATAGCSILSNAFYAIF